MPLNTELLSAVEAIEHKYGSVNALEKDSTAIRFLNKLANRNMDRTLSDNEIDEIQKELDRGVSKKKISDDLSLERGVISDAVKQGILKDNMWKRIRSSASYAKHKIGGVTYWDYYQRSISKKQKKT